MEDTNQFFKFIIAIKLNTDEKIDVSIGINKLRKVAALPIKEGIFLDLEETPLTPIEFQFIKKDEILGDCSINLPEQIFTTHEVEISNDFKINNIVGSYYIIILNKKFNSKILTSDEGHNRQKTHSKHQPEQEVHKNKDVTVKVQPINNSNNKKIQNKHYNNKRQKNLSEKINESIKRNDFSIQETENTQNETQKSSSIEKKNYSSKAQKPKNDYSVTHLKNIIFAMDQKIQQLSNNSKINEQLYSQVDQLELQKSELLKNLNETLKKNNDFQTEIQRLQKENHFNNIQIEKKQQEKQQEILKQNQRITNLQSEVKQLEKVIQEQRGDGSFKNEQKQTEHQMHRIIEQKEDIIRELIKKNEKQVSAFQDMAKRHDQVVKQLQTDNLNQQKQIYDLKLQSEMLMDKKASLERSLYDLEIQKNLQIEQKQEEINNITSDTDINQQLIKELRNQIEIQNLDISSFRKQLTTQSQELLALEQQQQEKIIQEQKKQLEAESIILNFKQINGSQKLEIEQLKQKQSQNEQMDNYVQNLEDSLQKNYSKVQLIFSANDKLNLQIDDLQQQITELTNSLQESNKQGDELRNQVTERDSQIQNLQKLIIQLREKSQYQAHPNDQIDRKLSEYLNEYQQKIKPFVFRESEGIYCFGTRRVFLKLEQDKILVKIGGGFIRLEEFIEKLDKTELQNLGKTTKNK